MAVNAARAHADWPPGLVAGFSAPQTVHPFIVQFTADVPTANKIVNVVGGNGEHPSQLRVFSGVRDRQRYYCLPFVLNAPPLSSRC